MRTIQGRAAVLEAAGHHPFARLRAVGEHISGYQEPNALVWTARRPAGDLAGSLGDPVACADLLARLHREGRLGRPRFLELPRIGAGQLPAPLALDPSRNWALLWTERPPSTNDGNGIGPLSPDAYPEVEHLLNSALPYTRNRPGNPEIRAWYGIRVGAELAAVAADRREEGLGYIAGVATLPAHQGLGLGARLIRWLTTRLIGEFGICLLGVMTHNPHARAVFTHLGYTDAIELSAATMPEPG